MEQSLLSNINNNTLPNSTNMELQNIQHNLSQVFLSLQSSFYILLKHYQPYLLQYFNYIKLIILLILTYIFYKIGGMTVSDKIQKEKEKLKQLITKKNCIQIQLPKKISKIKSNTVKAIPVCIILAASYAYLFYTGNQVLLQQYQLHIVGVASLLVLYIIFINIQKIILKKRLQSTAQLQHQIAKKINQFTNKLGSKVTAILTHHLCRQQQIKFSSSRNINQCSKQQCKQYRGLLKQRNDAIATLVQQTIDFEWCSVCKKRNPFDQYLQYESRQYNKVQQQNEQVQVKNKQKYLMDEMQRMSKWLRQTSPCNCSKLYWTTSTQHIIQYKRIQKAIQTKIKELQSKHK